MSEGEGQVETGNGRVKRLKQYETKAGIMHWRRSSSQWITGLGRLGEGRTVGDVEGDKSGD